MPSTRMYYIAFWVFIVGMLLWQFIAYNHHLDQKVIDAGPQQKQFFFNSKTMAPPPPPKPDAADVQQINFSTSAQTPVQGRFTCHVTLKNKGNLKATNVQVMVTPFRGAAKGAANAGRGGELQVVTDSDPISLMAQSLSFPDMAPGAVVTKDIEFTNEDGYQPGDNSGARILFQSEKPQVVSPAPVSPPPR